MMTPIDMGNYSQEILKQAESALPDCDLTGSQRSWRITHPVVLKHRMGHRYPDKNISQGVNFYSVIDEKKANHPLAFPYEIYQFLQEKKVTILHVPKIGVVTLSSSPLPLHGQDDQGLAGAWLDFALSPELWGPDGKWLRFHLRLQECFSRARLITGRSIPGYYELRPQAKAIESFGFYGADLGEIYRLILPWDFSLNELSRLERIINEERFPCTY